MTRFLNTDLDVTLGGLTPSDEKVSSQKATKTYVDTRLSTKQDTLVSGTNIKTLNNQSILGAGNIEITSESAQWGKIGGNITMQYDLQEALDLKQNNLTSDNAGDNISIDYEYVNIFKKENIVIANSQFLDDGEVVSDSTYDIYKVDGIVEGRDYTIQFTGGSTDTDVRIGTFVNNQLVDLLLSIEVSASEEFVAHFPIPDKEFDELRVSLSKSCANVEFLQGLVKISSDISGKQDVIPDLGTIRTNAEAGKSASDTIVGYGNIVTHNTNEFQPAGDYATNEVLTNGLATKQNTITDLTVIRSNSSAGKSASDTIAGYGDIVSHNANEFQPAGNYALKSEIPTVPTNVSAFINDSGYITSAYHDSTKQDVISEGNAITIQDNVVAVSSVLTDQVEKNKLDIQEIEAARFVDATIIGEPTILQGQVSGFSTVSYLQYPSILDLRDQAFQIDFCFTTAANVQTQQNILDSNFGIALAIANGKGLMAISSNGTSWNIGSAVGQINIQSNTTYYARLTWNKLQYKTALSTDGINYTEDMVLVGAARPYPRTIYIGGCDQAETGHTPHPFLGSINMNKASVTVMGNVIWRGMGDIGLATKADVSLDNLDALGQAKFDAKQDVISDIDTIRSNASSAKSTVDTHVANGTIHVTAGDKIAWSNKQNKLVAGANIAIDESTNTISATGGGRPTYDEENQRLVF